MLVKGTLKTPRSVWLSQPAPGHGVHFYPFDSDLLESLTDYFYKGLLAGDTCIVIATPQHITTLNANLRAMGVDIAEAINDNQYVMLDAENTLAEFMVRGLPLYEQFFECIGRTLTLASGRGKPIRAFGEMVALLWEQGNLSGLLQLEKYWHNLVDEHAFSLYCGYPSNLFDDSTSHRHAVQTIRSGHSFSI